jgi:hypothetical protein
VTSILDPDPHKKYLLYLAPSNDVYTLDTIIFAISEKKIFTIFLPFFPMHHYYKLNNAVASILGLRINIKNINFVKNHPLIIYVKFGFNQVSRKSGEDLCNFSQPAGAHFF